MNGAVDNLADPYPEERLSRHGVASAHRRIRFVMLVIALTALTWSTCQAIGSFQTRPAFPSAVGADSPPQPPAITWPSASAFFSGCGKGRIGDPQTHGCRGPADVRIAR